MEKVLKGYTFRLYPNNEQKILIEKSFGCSRYIYNYFLHKTSKQLAEENDLIITEKLKINELVQNSKLSKKIYDSSWYELIRQLQYKSKWNGKICYQIDTYYPSSQTCSRCGSINKSVKDLKVRMWECPNCTNVNNRDINASINILWEGVKAYMGCGNNTELQVN